MGRVTCSNGMGQETCSLGVGLGLKMWQSSGVRGLLGRRSFGGGRRGLGVGGWGRMRTLVLKQQVGETRRVWFPGKCSATPATRYPRSISAYLCFPSRKPRAWATGNPNRTPPLSTPLPAPCPRLCRIHVQHGTWES